MIPQMKKKRMTVPEKTHLWTFDETIGIFMQKRNTAAKSTTATVNRKKEGIVMLQNDSSNFAVMAPARNPYDKFSPPRIMPHNIRYKRR